MKFYMMWMMTVIDIMTVIAGAAAGYISGNAVGLCPELSGLLLNILGSLTGINGIDLTSFMTVIGLYVGIVCVIFGVLWQLPLSQADNIPNIKGGAH